MAAIYNNIHVDEKYSAILEPNLYHDSVMVAGQTFNADYEEQGGTIFVRKINAGTVTPGTPGRDFNDQTTQDTLIPIAVNNNYQQSEKIYGVQAENVEAPLADAKLSAAVQTVGEGWNISAVACLAEEGTPATTQSTKAKDILIDMRQQVRDNKGTADVALVSTGMYAKILKEAGADFTPVANDETEKTGQKGLWFGMLIAECTEFGESAAKYYDSTGALKTVDLTGIDVIVYNHRAFSIVNNFNVARIIDSEMFAGSKAQVEMNSGFKVTSAGQVIVK